MKHIFIINPISGSRKFNLYMDYIEEIAAEKNIEYEVVLTQYADHASRIAGEYNEGDDVCLYVFGGDGTVHEVVNGINENVQMAIIPVGTGNDFYRYFNTDISDIRKLISDTIDGKAVKVDLGCVNDIKFINCFSMGFDAIVSDSADKMIRDNKTPNQLAYLICALRELISPDLMDLKIEIDDSEVMEKTALIMAVMNGKYYGGGFMPTPEASIKDGKLDFCLIEKLSKLKTMRLIPAYMKGKHTGISEVSIRQFRKLHISSAEELTMEVDGETFYSREADVRILENHLTLRLPQHIDI